MKRRKPKTKTVGFWENGAGTLAGQQEVWAARGDITAAERRALHAYMKAATVEASANGVAKCRACKDRLGSQDMLTPDGQFIFPSGYWHYIDVHEVRPPSTFICAAMDWNTGVGDDEEIREAMANTIANELDNQDWTFGTQEVVSAVTDNKGTGVLVELSNGAVFRISIRRRK